MSRRRAPSKHPRLFDVEPLPWEIEPPEYPRLFEFIDLGSEPAPELAVGGAGLFVEELALGPGALDPDDEAAILSHLVAVARARGVPLHAAVAWNALYFGYEPKTPGYDLDLFGEMDLAPLVAGERSEALPVGAMVTFTYNQHEEWAEVLYKEGRPLSALDGDLVRPRYSGAIGMPEPTTDGIDVLTEMLVLDFDPFNAIGNRDRSWLDRVRAHPERTSLDASGHVTMDAFYADGGALNGDLDYFCEWMLEHHSEVLARGWLGAALEDPDDEAQLSEAMSNSVRAIEALLEASDEFAEWGGYWYLKEDLASFSTDPDTHGGKGDAGHLLGSMAGVPSGDRVAYHPVARHLGEVLSDEELAFERYARHIVYANVLMAEALTERGNDGVLTRAGENFVVRLDDAWLFGGTWRSERLDGHSTCSLVGYDPTMTLGLGASGEADDVHVPIEVESEEPAAETALDAEGAEGEAAEPAPPGEPFHWSAVLRETHRTQERIWVHPDAALAPTPDGHVVLRLTHGGDISDDERVQLVELSGDGGWLHPVHFPLDFFTGIRLSCLAQRGGSVVWASTEALPEPIDLVGHLLGFAYDRHVVDPERPRQPEPRLVTRALRTIDRYGEDMGERWHKLDADSIAELIFGPEVGTIGAEAVASALGEAPDVTTCDLEGNWWHRAPAAGRRRFEPPTKSSGSIFTRASGGLRRNWSGAQDRHRREHRVVLHLRDLRVSEAAPPERAAAYEALRERAPNRASLPKTLPRGKTYVVSHTRGRKGGTRA